MKGTAPALLVFLLSPFVAEFLLGSLAINQLVPVAQETGIPSGV